MGAAILPILLPDRVLVDAASGPPRYVLYGSAAGLAGANQTITQANSESGDAFGTALAKGDFDGDGITDLAVGASGETVGGDPLAGAVTVFYGSAGGLGSAGQTIFQANPEPGDQFGFSLASGELQDSGRSDLAIGAPGEDVGALTDSGVVHVQYGTPGGLFGAGFLSQDTTNVPGQAEAGDTFGLAMTTGGFSNNTGVPNELAVGAPGEDVGTAREAGAVNILRGVVLSGPPSGGQLFTQGRVAGGQPEPLDSFGAALA